jgi:hypothetical protein
MIPSKAHVKEISGGVEHITRAKGTKAARQFLSSLAYVLVHGEPKSAKFQFVVEMAHILGLTKCLDLLERVATSTKSVPSSSDSDDSISEATKAQDEKSLKIIGQDINSAFFCLGGPLLCLVAVLTELILSIMKGQQVSYGFLATLLAAASLSGTNRKIRMDIKSVAFNVLFTWAHTASIHSDDLTSQMTAYGKALAITFALLVLNTSHSRSSNVSSVLLPQLVFARRGYNPSTIFRFMKHALPLSDAAFPQGAMHAHAWTTHISCAVLAPAFLTYCISQFSSNRVHQSRSMRKGA